MTEAQIRTVYNRLLNTLSSMTYGSPEWLLFQTAIEAADATADLRQDQSDRKFLNALLTPLATPAGASFDGTLDVTATGAFSSFTCGDGIELAADGQAVASIIVHGTNFFAIRPDNLPDLESISLPDVVSLAGSSLITAVDCASLISFSAPLLEEMIGINSQLVLQGVGALETFDVPNLVTHNGILGVTGSAFLTTLNLPALLTCRDMSSHSNPALTTLNFHPDFLPRDDADFDLSDNALNQASVDFILRRCVLNANFDGTVHLNGGTTSPPSDPAGLADVATLSLRGCDILTNV